MKSSSDRSPPPPFQLPENLFASCLSPTDSSTAVRFHEALSKAAAATDLHIEAFSAVDVGEYEELRHCRRTLQARPSPIPLSIWGGPDHDVIETEIVHGVWSIEWLGKTLYQVRTQWEVGFGGPQTHEWIVASSANVAKAFLLAVARATNEPRDAILVFHGSCWERNTDLYKSTQRSSFEDLILAPALKERIRTDFLRFVESRAAYEEVGLAWRRGALLLGPPGNGKTHCVRALVKELGIPTLYVQSIKTRYETEESNLKKVFERARQIRPCILVLEDIDALINAENRSFFLNQLDGFEKNVGMIVIATTNHPEKIDAAILDRPSRFDRKYHFELPALSERSQYLSLWQSKLAEKTSWSEALSTELAGSTEGFSFAYLKELVTATLQRFAGGDGTFADLARDERDTLKKQMTTAAGAGATESRS